MSHPAEHLTAALADRYRIERELGAGGDHSLSRRGPQAPSQSGCEVGSAQERSGLSATGRSGGSMSRVNGGLIGALAGIIFMIGQPF